MCAQLPTPNNITFSFHHHHQWKDHVAQLQCKIAAAEATVEAIKASAASATAAAGTPGSSDTARVLELEKLVQEKEAKLAELRHQMTLSKVLLGWTHRHMSCRA
jgi:hypothetical protein